MMTVAQTTAPRTQTDAAIHAVKTCSRPRWACPSGVGIGHYRRSVSDLTSAFSQSPPGPPGRAATAENATGPRDGVLVTNPFNERTCSGNLGMPLMSNVRFAELPVSHLLAFL